MESARETITLSGARKATGSRGMNAAVFYKGEPSGLFVNHEVLPIPAAKGAGVLVSVKATGICGSDLHEWLLGGAARRKDQTLPGQVAGHEITGEVAECGPDAKRFKVGDRVVVAPTVYCGECFLCRKGMINICLNRKGIGSELPGGFAQYLSVPERNVFALPPDLPFDEGTLIEPLSVAAEAMHRAGDLFGRTVAIIGAGPIGIMLARLAHFAGAARLFVVEPRASRRAATESAGASALDPEGALDGVTRGTENKGVDVAFECVGGSGKMLDQAISLTARTGTIVGVGRYPSEVRLSNLDKLIEKSIDYKGLQGYQSTFPMAVKLLAEERGAFRGLITHRVSLSDIRRGLDLAKDARSDAIKVVVVQQ